MEEEPKVEEVKKRPLKEHFAKYYKYYLVGILVLAFIIRLYMFVKFHAAGVWWDEADYLALSRNFALGTPEQAPPYRAWGIAILYTPLYWLGLGEYTFKFLEIIFSVLGVYLTYLIGKEFFGKRVGLIAAFGMSTYWVHLFWTAKISMGVIGMLCSCGAALFFYRGYIKNEGKKYLIYAGALIGYGIILYESVGFIIPFMILFLLVTEKWRFVLNKKFWIFILAMFLAALPFLIVNQVMYGSPYARLDMFFNFKEIGSSAAGVGGGVLGSLGLEENAGQIIWQSISIYFVNLPMMIQWGFLILVIIGLYGFLNMFLGFDLVWKNKSSKLKKDFYVLLWPISFLVIVGYLVSSGHGFYFEPRFAFPAMPMIFAIAGSGALILYNSLKKYNRILGIAVVLGLLVWGGYSGVKYGIDLSEAKYDAFYYEREAGEWLK